MHSRSRTHASHLESRGGDQRRMAKIQVRASPPGDVRSCVLEVKSGRRDWNEYGRMNVDPSSGQGNGSFEIFPGGQTVRFKLYRCPAFGGNPYDSRGNWATTPARLTEAEQVGVVPPTELATYLPAKSTDIGSVEDTPRKVLKNDGYGKHQLLHVLAEVT